MAGLPFAIQLGHSLRAHYAFQNEENQITNLLTQIPAPAVPHTADGTPDNAYNYDRMLSLITKTAEIKAAYRAQYAQVENNAVKPLSAKDIKRVLEDLYREKERFCRYANNVRKRYKGLVPLRRARSIEYQKHTLEKSATELENFLRRL
jgi:hypothetical protein